jgi:ribonucleotide reductase alpha subunit
VQKFTDGSVSKTVNMPKGTTKEQLSELLLNNIKHLKGVTVYVDGSRSGQILNRMSDVQVAAYLKKNGKDVSHFLSEEDSECSICSRGKTTKTPDMDEIKEKVLKDILSKRGSEK